eukprot:c20596_g1_i2 orf=491-955(+)
MSCMTRAMGGRHLLEAMSPVRLFYSVGGDMGISSKEGDRSCDGGIGMDNDSTFCSNTDGGNGNIVHNEDVGVQVNGDNDGNLIFPSCTLLCSSCDTVVPPDTSIAFQAVLQEHLGLESEVIMFDSLRHGDFVTLDGRLPEQVSLRNQILHILQA